MKIRVCTLLAAVAATATGAFGQAPTPTVDLGTISNGVITTTLSGFNSPSGSNRTQWIKVTLPSGATNIGGGFLDITTNGGTFTGTDTQIAIYNNSGARIGVDDEDGPSSYSQLTFGQSTPIRAAVPVSGNATVLGLTRAGIDGANTVNAGTYWIAIGGFSTTYATTNWGVTTSHTRTGDTVVRIEYQANTVTTPPSGVNGASAPTLSGGSTVLSLVVTPGVDPVSSGLAVSVNLSSIGGSPTQQFFDDGTNGDITAGDNIFSFATTLSGPQGTYVFPATITDAQSRSASATVRGVIGADLGTPSAGLTSINALMAANEVKWYRIVLPNNLSAASGFLDVTTLPGIAPTFTSTDTEIGLYTAAGVLEDTDDDDGNLTFSELTWGQTLPARTTETGALGGNGRDGVINAGTYWLAVGGFNSTFGANFGVASTSTATGNIGVNIRFQDAGAPTNPAISTTAVSPIGPKANGDTVLLTATAVPGLFPNSTGLTVTGNLTSIGGSSTQQFFDNGTNGDVTPGDNIFSYSATITGAVAGTANVPLTVTDAQSRSGSGNIGVSIAADLGTLSSGANVDLTATLAAGEIKWYKLTVADAIATPSNWLDIWTIAPATGALSNGDSEIGLYTAAGVLEDTDDDDGDVNYSALTYGATSPTRPTGGAGTASNGRDGALAAGTYYLALGAFNSTFNANFGAVSTSTATGDVRLRITRETTTNPSGTGTATPNSVDVSLTPANSLLRVTTQPGAFPTSSGLTVTADLGSIGGSLTQQFFDDATNGDVTAGDGIFSFDATIPTGLSTGSKSITFTVADAQSRTGSGSFSIFTFGAGTHNETNCGATDAGQLPASAQNVRGSGNLSAIRGNIGVDGDVDMYRIAITDPTTFSASTVGLTSLDTELFLFDSSGVGIAQNDDEVGGTSLQSRITNTFTSSLAAGNYLLAVSQWQSDPVDSTPASLWLNTNPTRGESAPNGPGAANPVAGWNGGVGTGAYAIALSGAGYTCIADTDDGSGTGVPDGGVGIEDLLYYLGVYDAGLESADVDDGNNTGTCDGGVGIEDLLYYLARYDAGC